MRIFKTKWFARFARKEKIGAAKLREAISRAENGSSDAELGAGLIKRRIAREGKGRSGGYRTLLALQVRSRSVFLYAFAKSEAENIDELELDGLKKLARRYLAMTDGEIDAALMAMELTEVFDGDEGKG